MKSYNSIPVKDIQVDDEVVVKGIHYYGDRPDASKYSNFEHHGGVRIHFPILAIDRYNIVICQPSDKTCKYTINRESIESARRATELPPVGSWRHRDSVTGNIDECFSKSRGFSCHGRDPEVLRATGWSKDERKADRRKK
jgi:hypothetical protein